MTFKIIISLDSLGMKSRTNLDKKSNCCTDLNLTHGT